MTPERAAELEAELVDFFQQFPLDVPDPGPIARALIEGGWRFVGEPDSCCPEQDTVMRMREHLAEVNPAYRIVRSDRVPEIMVTAGVFADPTPIDPDNMTQWNASAKAVRAIVEAALKASPT